MQRAWRRDRTTCVNSGNYYDIVQLAGFQSLRQVVGHQGRYPDLQGEGEHRFRRPARECRRAGGQAEAEFGRPAHQHSSFANPARPGRAKAPTYTDVLPSLNLFYDFDRHNRIRFAVAKVMARPRMDDMRANLVPGFNGQVCDWAPYPPVRARHGSAPVVGVGRQSEARAMAREGNRRRLRMVWRQGDAISRCTVSTCGWTTTSTRRRLPAISRALPRRRPICATDPAGCGRQSDRQLDAPANGQGGWVRGVEVERRDRVRSASVMYWTVLARPAAYPGPTTSSSRRLLGVYGGVLPGFSKWVYDITGYYEKNGFQARAAYRHRSAFKGEVVCAVPRTSASR